jgi:tetratricopeptide (TPR) repeat protein
MMLILSACANPYAQFYKGNADVRSNTNYDSTFDKLQIYSSSNFEHDTRNLLRQGYLQIGTSSFNASADSVNERQLTEYAKTIGAHAVLVSSKFSHTVTGALPLTLPNNTTSYSTGTATAYGNGGSVTAYGSGTTTTYGTQTTMIPYSIQRSDFSAVFFAKFNIRVGIVAEPLDESSRRRLQSNNAIKVMTVVEGSPAYKADVIDGDLVLSIEGDSVTSLANYFELLNKHQGRTAKFVFERDGKTIEKQIDIRSQQVAVARAEPIPTQTKSSSAPISQEALAWNDKSLASANRGDWVDAIRTATVAISLNKNYASAYINRCRAYSAHNDFEEALNDCNMALTIEPNNPAAINNVGSIMQKQGKTDDALPKYYAACEIGLTIACDNFKALKGYSPKDKVGFSQSKLDEANSYFKNKNWDMAIVSATSAIEVNPDNESAYVTRSGAFANAGQLDKALADSETAIIINPDDGVTYNNRAFVFELSGKKKQARLDYEIACNLKLDLGCKNFKRLSQ